MNSRKIAIIIVMVCYTTATVLVGIIIGGIIH